MESVAEDIFKDIIESNPDLTPEQRIVVWEIVKETCDDINTMKERVSCLNV